LLPRRPNLALRTRGTDRTDLAVNTIDTRSAVGAGGTRIALRTRRAVRTSGTGRTRNSRVGTRSPVNTGRTLGAS
jgi:hypothetical protein